MCHFYFMTSLFCVIPIPPKLFHLIKILRVWYIVPPSPCMERAIIEIKYNSSPFDIIGKSKFVYMFILLIFCAGQRSPVHQNVNKNCITALTQIPQLTCIQNICYFFDFRFSSLFNLLTFIYFCQEFNRGKTNSLKIMVRILKFDISIILDNKNSPCTVLPFLWFWDCYFFFIW